MAVTRSHYSSGPQRKKPKAGDRRFLKGRQVWQVRQQCRVSKGLPHAGAYIVSNGRPVWEWVDEPTQQPRQSECQHMPISSEYGTWCELCEKKLSN